MTSQKYPIFDISHEIIDDYEQMGSKSKFWYTDSKSGLEYLFKSIETQDKHGKPETRIGENWAEKIACEIAGKLDIPHAHYDLAVYRGEQGTISKKFTARGSNMFFGNQLIEHVVASSGVQLESGQRSQRIDRVSVILDKIIQKVPLGWQHTDRIRNAFDVFIGYVMLDTLISNQDRHNENWAMIVGPHGASLAPSFDHASSLGRNESHKNMIDRIFSKDAGRQIPTYVGRCKSFFYHENKRLKTLDAFCLFGYQSKAAAVEWLERLEALSDIEIQKLINRVPDVIMNSTQKTFCFFVILANKARLLQYKPLFVE